jgi:hypothetical protein
VNVTGKTILSINCRASLLIQVLEYKDLSF